MPSKSASNKKATKSARKEATPEPVKEAAPAKEAAAVTSTTESEETVFSIFQQIRDRVSAQERELRELRVMLKRAEQVYKREQRLAAQRTARAMPKRKRARNADPNKQRNPSGIAKPTRISPELAKFLSVEPSALMARTEVIKLIASYIKEHKLENTENRREIVPDKALGRLLGASKSDKVTYFNLQRYMKRHFPKMEATAST